MIDNLKIFSDTDVMITKDVLDHLVAPLKKVNTPEKFESLYKHCFKEALKTNGNINISEIPKAELGISGNERWQEDDL